MEKKYVIGVDGGGTKTVAALANLEGKILNITRTGPSNPRNIGIKITLENIAKAIEENLKKIKKGKISAVFIGLAGFEEEYKFKKEKIRKILFKNKKIKPIFKGKVKIGSDQIVAFRSGTGRKEGILLIAGTGCVAHGWRAKKEFKISGWGWLADEGSAFWIGQRGYQALFKELDGRGPKTLITKLIFQEFKLKNQNDLMLKIYSLNTRAAAKGFEENFVLFSRLTFLSSGSAEEEDLSSLTAVENISSLSVLVDKAAKRGDKVAERILIEAGQELILAVKTIIKKLNFPRSGTTNKLLRNYTGQASSLRGRQNQKFPLVLVGGVFNSEIILKKLKKEIKKFAPRVEFIQPEAEPVTGAIKLAIEMLKK